MSDIWPSVITVLGTVLGVIVSNRLSLGTSAGKKLHEDRVAAYTEIVAALFEIEFMFDAARSWINDGENLHSYFESERSDRDQSDIMNALEVAKKTFNKNCLVISKEFSQAFASFEGKIKSDPNDDFEDAFNKFSKEVSEAKKILENIGRKEVEKFVLSARIRAFFDKPCRS